MDPTVAARLAHARAEASSSSSPSTPTKKEAPPARDEQTVPMTPNTLSRIPADLSVHFDDGTVVKAHALILALASPVFSDMLTTAAGLRKSVSLSGKSAQEFEVFLRALYPASMRFQTLADEETFMMLCRWASEFAVAGLTTSIEDHLLKDVAVDEASLGHALSYGLARRKAQCITVMQQDLPRCDARRAMPGARGRDGALVAARSSPPPRGSLARRERLVRTRGAQVCGRAGRARDEGSRGRAR